MLFKVIGIVFILIFSFRDTEEDRLKKEKQEWKNIMGRRYE